MGFEAKGSPAGQVDGDLRIAKLRPERIDRHPTDGHGVRPAGSLRETAKDGELVVPLRRIVGRDRLLGESALGEQALNVSTPEAPVAARVDAIGGKTT